MNDKALKLARWVILGPEARLPDPPHLHAAGAENLVQVALLGVAGDETRSASAIVRGVDRLNAAILLMAEDELRAPGASGWVEKVATAIAVALLPGDIPLTGSAFARLERAGAAGSLNTLFTNVSRLFWDAQVETGAGASRAIRPQLSLRIGERTATGTGGQIVKALYLLRLNRSFPQDRLPEIDPVILTMVGMTLALLGLEVEGSTGTSIEGLLGAAATLHGPHGPQPQLERMQPASEVLASLLRTRLPDRTGTIQTLLRNADTQATDRLINRWDADSAGALGRAVMTVRAPTGSVGAAPTGSQQPAAQGLAPSESQAVELLSLPLRSPPPPRDVDLRDVSPATLAKHTAARLRMAGNSPYVDPILLILGQFVQAVKFVQGAFGAADDDELRSWTASLREEWAAALKFRPHTDGRTTGGGGVTAEEVLRRADVTRGAAMLHRMLAVVMEPPSASAPSGPNDGHEGVG